MPATMVMVRLCGHGFILKPMRLPSRSTDQTGDTALIMHGAASQNRAAIARADRPWRWICIGHFLSRVGIRTHQNQTVLYF